MLTYVDSTKCICRRELRLKDGARRGGRGSDGTNINEKIARAITITEIDTVLNVLLLVLTKASSENGLNTRGLYGSDHKRISLCP